MKTQNGTELASVALPTGPLVSTEWLDAHLGAGNLRIVDVRGEVGGQPPAKRADYEQAHIPGAVFADWTADFVDPNDPLPVQLAPPDLFQASAGRLGIGDDTVVVAYDDFFNIFAGRLWWALRAYGHDAVRVLDGGWQSWIAEARTTTTEEPALPTATFIPRPLSGHRQTLADLEAAWGRGATLIDARPRHLYEGDPQAPRSGHIPGAVSVPYPELVDGESGRFRSRPELRAIFATAGIDPDDTETALISSCGSGVSASVPCIALDLLGRPAVPVFDGSFAEWIADDNRPAAQGRTAWDDSAKMDLDDTCEEDLDGPADQV